MKSNGTKRNSIIKKSQPNTATSPILGGEVAVVVVATANCIRVVPITQLKIALLSSFTTDHFVLTTIVCSLLGQKIFVNFLSCYSSF